MATKDNLEILLLSNYECILYKSENGKFFLSLTRESGFGVYNYAIEPLLTDIEDLELTKKEIYSLLKRYQTDPDKFVKDHKEVHLNSVDTKAALDYWKVKNQ